MSETLFDQLNRRDRGIANVFKDWMRGKPPNTLLDRTGTERIFSRAIHDSQINTGEAEALVLLIDNGVLSSEAWSYLQAQLASEDGENALFRGTKNRRSSAADLRDFNGALDHHNVKTITFWSPGSLHHYRPMHYLAVKELVRKGKIKVFELRAAELNKRAKLGTGIYDDGTNEFLLYQGATKTPLIIHESTHAIQDWRNFGSTRQDYLEADAYIAEALAMVDLNIQTGWTPPGRAAQTHVVPVVLAGTAVQSNSAWIDANGPYFKVVQSVRASPGSTRNLKESSGPNEKDAMNKVLQALRKAGKF